MTTKKPKLTIYSKFENKLLSDWRCDGLIVVLKNLDRLKKTKEAIYGNSEIISYNTFIKSLSKNDIGIVKCIEKWWNWNII